MATGAKKRVAALLEWHGMRGKNAEGEGRVVLPTVDSLVKMRKARKKKPAAPGVKRLVIRFNRGTK